MFLPLSKCYENAQKHINSPNSLIQLFKTSTRWSKSLTTEVDIYTWTLSSVNVVVVAMSAVNSILSTSIKGLIKTRNKLSRRQVTNLQNPKSNHKPARSSPSSSSVVDVNRRSLHFLQSAASPLLPMLCILRWSGYASIERTIAKLSKF